MKQDIRSRIQEERTATSYEFRKNSGVAIKDRLFSTREFITSKNVMIYASKAEEVYTHDIIRESLYQGKNVVVPITNVKTGNLNLSFIRNFDKDLSSGTFGVPEPRKGCVRKAQPGDIRLAVVPGIVFDIHGNRIGYGRGYYDRFLARLGRNIPVFGLAYDFQVVYFINASKTDFPVSKIITEKRVIDCR